MAIERTERSYAQPETSYDGAMRWWLGVVFVCGCKSEPSAAEGQREADCRSRAIEIAIHWKSFVGYIDRSAEADRELTPALERELALDAEITNPKFRRDRKAADAKAHLEAVKARAAAIAACARDAGTALRALEAHEHPVAATKSVLACLRTFASADDVVRLRAFESKHHELEDFLAQLERDHQRDGDEQDKSLAELARHQVEVSALGRPTADDSTMHRLDGIAAVLSRYAAECK